MGLRQARIWQVHLFKQLRLFGGTPKRILPNVFISEIGEISLELLPTITGLSMHDASRMGWAVVQKLKMPMEKYEQPVSIISERSFMPLDPLGVLTGDERKQLGTVNELAKAKYAEERSKVDAESKHSNYADLIKTIVYLMFLCVIVLLIITWWKK